MNRLVILNEREEELKEELKKIHDELKRIDEERKQLLGDSNLMSNYPPFDVSDHTPEDYFPIPQLPANLSEVCFPHSPVAQPGPQPLCCIPENELIVPPVGCQVQIEDNILHPYFGIPPQDSLDSFIAWFDSTEGWEHLSISRPFRSRDLSEEQIRTFYEERMSSIDSTIERVVINRAQRGFKKQISIRRSVVVAVMDEDEWRHWKEIHNVPLPDVSYQKPLYYANHGSKRAEFIDRIGWTKPPFPALFHKFWWFKKWTEDSGNRTTLYRAMVESFTMAWNSWTEVVRVEYNYEIWYYDWKRDNWKTI